MSKTITIAHSPDADDAFMFYALAEGKVGPKGFGIRHAIHDIETLNRSAEEGRYEVTALSFHAYAHLQDRYRLLSVGSSLGEGCGPVVVGRGEASVGDLAGSRIAVPGERTTAHLVLRLLEREFEPVFVHFDEVVETMSAGEADFGVLIHEGQLTYGEMGLHRIIDLGGWWAEKTDLPLPLGANAVRRDLDEALARETAGAIRASIRYALDHRQEALEYALGFGRGIDRGRGDRFVGMYVNPFTLDLGAVGLEAVRTLLGRAREEGWIPEEPRLDILG